MSILRGFLIGIGGATAAIVWFALAGGPLLYAVGNAPMTAWPIAGIIWMAGISSATAAVCERFGIDLTPARPVYPPPPSFPDK